IVEPLATNVDVEIRRQMKETDRIKTIPRARTDRSVRVPAHVVLNNLCEPRAPVLLDAQFHHADKITGKSRGGEDGVRTEIDRSSQTRPPLFLQPVVDLTDVANRARAALNEKGVGTQGHSVPDIEPVGAVQVRQPAGKGTVLRVEELVIAGVEGSIRGEESIVTNDRVHSAELEVHPAVGKDRQVGRELQEPEVLAEVRVEVRAAYATLGLA